jgi:hypothetical protein
VTTFAPLSVAGEVWPVPSQIVSGEVLLPESAIGTPEVRGRYCRLKIGHCRPLDRSITTSRRLQRP